MIFENLANFEKIFCSGDFLILSETNYFILSFQSSIVI